MANSLAEHAALVAGTTPHGPSPYGMRERIAAALRADARLKAASEALEFYATRSPFTLGADGGHIARAALAAVAGKGTTTNVK